MDFAGTQAIYSVYGNYPQDNGQISRRLLGRFMIIKDKLTILEDHIGMLKSMLIEGPVYGANERALNSLSQSPYTEVVNEADVKAGKYLDLIPKEGDLPGGGPETEAPPPIIEKTPEIGNQPQLVDTSDAGGQFKMEPPAPVFDYFRVGMNSPQVVEVEGKTVYMNGHLLSPDEVDRLFYNVRNGLATLRYRKKA